MKLSISYKHVDAHEAIEKDVDRHVAKLNKLLKAYAPDLVQFHCVFGMNAHKEQYFCTLNLSLPTGAHARHRQRKKCTRQLQNGIQRTGNPAKKTPGPAKKRLPMEAQAPARPRTGGLLSLSRHPCRSTVHSSETHGKPLIRHAFTVFHSIRRSASL